jgi:hypothetical protein
MVARGTFEVKMIPPGSDDSAGGTVGRFFLNKKFEGELQAQSKGQMLTSGGPPSKSGAYVALEEVAGTLNGARGSFVLVHRGTMDEGRDQLEVAVVPGSGTGDLHRITGSMTIQREAGKHLYEFLYSIDR